MKFGKQLRFVAVRAWFENYIHYKELKNLIKSFVGRVRVAEESGGSPEEIAMTKQECYAVFKETLIENINCSVKFFSVILSDVTDKITDLENEVDEHAIELEDVNKDEDTAVSFYKRVFVNLLTVYEVRSFLAINEAGVRCIVKKFAKKLQFPECIEEFDMIRSSAFDHQPSVDREMQVLEELNLKIKRRISPEPDRRTRQEITLELHRNVEGSRLWKQATVLGKWQAFTFRQSEFHMIPSPIKWIPIIIGVILMLPFLFAPIFPEDDRRAQRALGVLIFCATLWSTAAVPLWVTSMSIPFLAVIVQLIPGDSIPAVGKQVQMATMSTTVWLIIGGFTIAAAFKETEMDKRIAAMALKRATKSVSLFVFVVIALNGFLAMWINNVASTMIVVTLVAPTLQQLPATSIFAKTVLLGIAAGGNFGGMMTPLASPQNAITIQSVEYAMARMPTEGQSSFGFVEFLVTAFPYAVLGIIVFWVLLMLVMKSEITHVPAFSDVNTDFGWRQVVVSIVTLVTITIWIVLPFGAQDIFADNGIVGFIPLLLFYGSGILPASRVAELPWNIIFLVMGGNALGHVVQESGLLELVSNLLHDMLGDTSLWLTLLIINLFVLIINVFVSHTVSSTILLPIVCEFALVQPHLRMFAMQACMATTSSQILPVSSFPNLCCVSLQDRSGKEYLSTVDIIKSGSIATIVSFTLLISVQYGISLAYGM